MAGYSVTVARDQRDFFADKGRFFGSFEKMSGIQFCQIIDKMFERDTRSMGANRTGGMPWVTPVLGSGCLAVGGSDDVNPDQVGRAVRSAALTLLAGHDAIEEDYEPEELAEMAGQFARALASERLIGDTELQQDRAGDDDLSDDIAEQAPPNVDVTKDSALALVAATLLNSTYHTYKAGAHTPPARGSDDVVSVAGRRSPGRKLSRECQHQCRQLRRRSERLRDASSQPTEWDAIASLLHDIGDDFHQDRVSLRNVGLLSEVAWYLLMREAGVYPGWNDLLFELMLIDDRQQEASERPWFKNLGEVGEKTSSLFLRPTLRSWRDRAGPASRAAGARRSEFFDAVAQLLKAQALTRRGAPRGFEPPVATAFVTSFDVELEMSLHQQLDAGDRIYVVFPVQVRPNADSKQAKLCWLRAPLNRPTNVVDGQPMLDGTEDSLHQFLQPTSWEVVWPNLEEDFDQVHLIHLAGCPLLDLPTVASDSGFLKDLALRLTDSAIEFDADELVLSHAVVVDEYLALQQSEAEMLWAVVHKNEPDSSLALPALFTGSDTADAASSPNPRFWMAMGVPLDDPAVRNRVITQLTIRRLLVKVGDHAKIEQLESAVSSADGEPDTTQQLAGGFGGMAAAINAMASVPPAMPEHPKRNRVFVSYSSKDEALARDVVERLKTNGVSCWFAPNDVGPGRHYKTEIRDAIDAVDYLLLILTPDAEHSDHVETELELFSQRKSKGTLFVLAVDGFEPARLVYDLAKVQRVNIPSDQPFSSDGWSRFVRHLSEIVHPATDSPSVRAPSEERAGGRVGGSLVGVVVNRRVHRDDAGMLHWLGLDVVCDDAADFTDDIRHLAEHLAAGRQNWDVPENRPCELMNHSAAAGGAG